MKFNKFFSIAYVMNRLQRNHKIPKFSYVIQNSTGIFTANPFIISDGIEKHLSFNETHWIPVFSEEIAYVDCHAKVFYEYLTSENPEKTWTSILNLFEYPHLLFDFLSNKYDSFETDTTNNQFDKKLHDVKYLDKDLTFEFIYTKDELNILSIHTHK